MTGRMAPPGWQVWTALGLVYVVWGSTYLGIRYVVESLPALLAASARFGLAGLLLAAYLVVRRGRAALLASGRQYANAVVVGLLLLLGGNGGVVLAEDQGLPSGLTALLIAVVPLWVVLLRMLDRDRPSSRTVLGVAIGFVGLTVLLGPGARPDDVGLGPAALIVSSSVLWSVGSYLATRLDLPSEPLVASVAEMLGGAVGLALFGLLRSERVHLADVEASSVIAFAYLVLVGSLVGFTAYSWLLGVAPVSKVATYAYVNPVVAVVLGALFVGEDITVASVAGGALTLAAVAVVVSQEGLRRRADPLAVPADAPAQMPDELQGRDRSSAT
ncbi:MAG: EamA family transporter [Frankiaceae bacterium]|nr:EamA family transporter [Frankiaceae bacterium]